MKIEEHTFNDAVQTLYNRNLSELNTDIHVQKAEQVHHKDPSQCVLIADLRFYCNFVQDSF